MDSKDEPIKANVDEVATVYTTKANIRTAETIMKHEENVRPIRVPPRNK